MKTSILFFSLALVSPVVAQTAPPTSVPAPATFDWKLRLVKGQTWTQTTTTKGTTRETLPDPSTEAPMKMDMSLSSTVGLKSQVLDATPTFYLIRSTYTRFDQKVDVLLNGKAAPRPSAPTPDMSKAFIGASFTIKQAPDGRVLEVSGLDDLLARLTREMNALFKTPQQRAAFAGLLPSEKTLRASIEKNQSASLPPAPLAVGQTYSYGSALSLPFASGIPTSVKGQRTLRSFDATSAIFDDNATFSIAPVQFLGPKTQTVVLTRDAAQMYLYAQAKENIARKTNQPVQFYLSKNGGIYYREPQSFRAIFVAPSAPNRILRVPRQTAERFADVIGYNNQKTGNSLDYYFSDAGGSRQPLSIRTTRPVVLPAQPKAFMAMSGAISGQSVVDAQTGLIRSSSITAKITGKVTVSEPNGHKTSVPIDSTSQTTISTTTP